MPKNKRKFYITTAIDYANAPLHLGHALEKVQADVLARYHRFLGEDVFFLTGSDENAQKNIQTAKEKRIPVKELVDKNVDSFRKTLRILNISNDDFIRTSDKKRHWPGVRKLWQECQKRGDIYKKRYSGFYCLGCEAFLTKKDLKNGLCPEHLRKPEKVCEENYFFRLSKYQTRLGELIESGKLKIFPDKRKNEILSFIKSGLEDFSISRPVKRIGKWGVSVPGDKSQIIYVWYDALSNYITALGYGSEDEKRFIKYWPADIHIIGKGIIRFHAVYWPAILLSAGIKLPRLIYVHGYLTINGQKISKSLGNIINPAELVGKYGTDAVRYFLLREILPTEDGDFSYKKFEERYNSDLANGLGNLVSRVISLYSKIKKKINFSTVESKDFNKVIKKTWALHRKYLKEFRFNDALVNIWQLISFSDRHIEKEKPWELISTTKRENAIKIKEEAENKLERILGNLLFTLKNLAELILPFMPETSGKISKKLKNKDKNPLFPRLTK